MKNVYEILKASGVEIESENKEKFEKEFFENYKTVNEVEKLENKINSLEEDKNSLISTHKQELKERDDDLAKVKKELENAGKEEGKLEEVTNKLNELQSTYDAKKDEYENKLSAQRKEFAIKEKANEIKFTSNAAKQFFIKQVLDADLKMENDKLLGFDDFVDGYKEQNNDSFVQEDKGNEGDNAEPEGTQPAPTFTGKSNKLDNPEPKEIKEVAECW